MKISIDNLLYMCKMYFLWMHGIDHWIIHRSYKNGANFLNLFKGFSIIICITLFICTILKYKCLSNQIHIECPLGHLKGCIDSIGGPCTWQGDIDIESWNITELLACRATRVYLFWTNFRTKPWCRNHFLSFFPW